MSKCSVVYFCQIHRQLVGNDEIMGDTIEGLRKVYKNSPNKVFIIKFFFQYDFLYAEIKREAI